MRLSGRPFFRGIMNQASPKLCGIICEYNPFHTGHRYHLEQARKLSGCDALIAVMSGNFVQRGKPAVLDKFIRAQEAVFQGADLVIELPAVFSLSSAPDFAYGAVKLLQLAGVKSICFGCECGDLAALRALASTNDLSIRNRLDLGFSFAEAACADPLLQSPNNILAVEYLRAIMAFGDSIRPIALQRKHDYHSNALVGKFASASAIRNNKENCYLDAKPYLSDFTWQALQSMPLPDMEILFSLLKYRLSTASRAQLHEINGITEGLENRFLKYATNCTCCDEFLKKISSKRYPKGKLQRIIINILLEIDKKIAINSKYSLGYLKVLAVRKSFLSSLKFMKDYLVMTNEDLPKITDEHDRQLLNIDRKASILYGILTKRNLPDQLSQPLIL